MSPIAMNVLSGIGGFVRSAGTDAKSVLLSRTFWVGALFILAGLIGLAALAYFTLPPGTLMACVTSIVAGASHIGLRFLTNQAVTLSWPQSGALAAKAPPPAIPIPIRYGGNRIAPNLIWHTDLLAVAAALSPKPQSAPPDTPAPSPSAPAIAEASPVPAPEAEAAPSIRSNLMDLGYIFTLAEAAPGVLSAGNTLYAEYKSGKLTEDNVLDAIKVLNQTFGDIFKDSAKVQGVVTQVNAAITAAEAAEAAAKPTA